MSVGEEDEKKNELKGGGGAGTFGRRQYDVRLPPQPPVTPARLLYLPHHYYSSTDSYARIPRRLICQRATVFRRLPLYTNGTPEAVRRLPLRLVTPAVCVYNIGTLYVSTFIYVDIYIKHYYRFSKTEKVSYYRKVNKKNTVSSRSHTMMANAIGYLKHYVVVHN